MNSNLTNLTEIWKKAGGGRRIAISNWKLCGGQKIIDSVKTRTTEEAWVSKKGKHGYTLATWEIAFAYARWISVDLYRELVQEWCGGDTAVMDMFRRLDGLTEAGKDLLILQGVNGITTQSASKEL